MHGPALAQRWRRGRSRAPHPTATRFWASRPGTPSARRCIRKLAYRPVDDFTYISTVTEYPFVLVTHPEHSIRTLTELVKEGRSRTEPLLYGGPNGTLQHLSVELLARTANIRVQLVPYRGSPQAVADLLGKRLDFMLDPPTAHLAAIKSGQLRALATTGASRFFALPDVPTVAEVGLSGFRHRFLAGRGGTGGAAGA